MNRPPATATAFALAALVLPGCVGGLSDRNEQTYRGHDAVERELNQHDLALGLQRFPGWIIDDGDRHQLFITGVLTNRADNAGLLIDYTQDLKLSLDDHAGTIEDEVDARLQRRQPQITVLVGEVGDGDRPPPAAARPVAIACLLTPLGEYLDVRVRYVDPAGGPVVEHYFPGCEVHWVNRHYSDRLARNLNYLWTVPVDIITWPFQFLFGIVQAHSDEDRPE